jgi:SepF-like predicted cell division protein (DUF552 family)
MIHFLVKPSGLILFLVTSYKMSIRISMVVARTRSELKKMQSNQHQPLYLKTVSIRNYLQLTKIRNNLFKKEPVILIARLTPIMLEDPEEGAKLLNELYSVAVKNNYSVFRLGEERIIVSPVTVQIEREKEDVISEKKHS